MKFITDVFVSKFHKVIPLPDERSMSLKMEMQDKGPFPPFQRLRNSYCYKIVIITNYVLHIFI